MVDSTECREHFIGERHPKRQQKQPLKLAQIFNPAAYVSEPRSRCPVVNRTALFLQL